VTFCMRGVDGPALATRQRRHSRMLQAADHYASFTRRRLEVPREANERAEKVMAGLMETLDGPHSYECGVWSPR